jgi:hypothetical protein
VPHHPSSLQLTMQQGVPRCSLLHVKVGLRACVAVTLQVLPLARTSAFLLHIKTAGTVGRYGVIKKFLSNWHGMVLHIARTCMARARSTD